MVRFELTTYSLLVLKSKIFDCKNGRLTKMFEMEDVTVKNNLPGSVSSSLYVAIMNLNDL